MDSAPLPPTPPPVTPPSFLARRLPDEVRFGIFSVLCGVAVSVASATWSYFGLQVFQPPSVAAYFQVGAAFSAANVILFDTGYFLIFRGILKTLESSEPIARIGPLLILVGGLALAAVDMVEVVLAPSLYTPYASPGLAWFYNVAATFFIATSLLVPLGMVLSFLAVAWRLVIRRPAALASPGP